MYSIKISNRNIRIKNSDSHAYKSLPQFFFFFFHWLHCNGFSTSFTHVCIETYKSIHVEKCKHVYS